MKNQQRELEDDMFEEEDDDSEDEEYVNQHEDIDMDELDVGEKCLMKEEFVSYMYNQFLEGKDKNFDYRWDLYNSFEFIKFFQLF